MKTAFGRVILSLAVCAFSLSSSAQSIAITTSDTLLPLGQKWAAAYAAKHTETKFQVTGGGTSAALATLAEQKASIAIIPRAMRYKEAQACEAALGQRPTEFKVGVSGAAVYVHTNNPVTVLMYEELEGIFKGKFRNWKQLGGKDAAIVAYGVETNSAAGELFAEEVLGGKSIINDVRIGSQAELLAAIAQNPNAIGFGAFVRAGDVRALDIKRTYSSTPVRPTPEDISNRIYPISRFLFCYVGADANKGETKAYIDWIRSDEGQQVAAQSGFYVLPSKWRAAP